MNRLVHIAAAGALLVFGAMAQNPEAMAKAKVEAETRATVIMKTVGAVRGMTVKGAPYSAEEVNETNQMLADGTRIHRENRTTVYRDSEGRTRRETPDNITITDPVANVTYLLDPKSMTGQKLAMSAGNFTFVRAIPRSGVLSHVSEPTTSTFSIHSSGDGPASITVNGVPLDEKAVAEAMAKAKASGSTETFTYERREITTGGGSGSGSGASAGTATGTGTWRVGGGVGTPTRVMLKRNAGESLGKQMIEGVNAEGTRSVTTIEAGDIGNDRPIQISNESWYSEELQMMVMSKRSDPRTGDETFRLTNIRRSEPGAYLFQAPAGYQINERK
ncbi:MAG: hypothetical protein NTW28_13925 [Candidatus Solibacter sp.]|nr:hypothetical protein [Candidatus Solibacter sp.]